MSLVDFTIGAEVFVITPMVGVMRPALGLTYAQMGFVLSTPFAGFALVGPIGGAVSQRLGSRTTIAISCILVSVGGLARSFAGGFVDLISFSLVLAVGYSLGFLAIAKMTTEWFPPNQAATAIGVSNAAFILGTLVVQSSTMSLAYPAFQDWRRIILLYGVISLPVAGLWWLVTRRARAEDRREDEGTRIFAGLARSLQNRGVWLVFFFAFCIIGAQTGVLTWLPTILSSKGISDSTAGLMSSTMVVGFIVANLALPMLSDRMGRRRVFLLLGCLMFALTLYLVGVATGAELWAIAFVMGLFIGHFAPMILAMCNEIPGIESRYYGSVASVVFVGSGLGSILEQPVAGYLRDLTGSFFPGLLFYIGMCALAASIVAALRDRR